ncbi:MAG: periplasmic heavy metal sensor [Candidatus Tectomicrobia bacterium]|uniref:Periplasmic heavy metal sensor n=1 Tax=Tectimicrobiota bacterium TaxID=2528274 RepID=A0A932I0S5_UNCTE|nr:periplasmic heavy metal sensor [Candidatus Tectomicrobia bacterium]
MRFRPAMALLLPLVFLASPASHAAESPYKGQEKRPIKALSGKEVEDLLAGNGMGLAKAAELNRYPGPLHVLESTSRLGLTETQRAETRRLFDAMKREAVPLGREIVERERELDARFASQEIDEASLAAALAEIGRLTGALRLVHLKAHLRMREILTPHQIALYGRARGYESSGGAGGHSGH